MGPTLSDPDKLTPFKYWMVDRKLAPHFFREFQSLDFFAADNMGLQNFFHVIRLHLGVPDAFRVNDHDGTHRTRPHTPGGSDQRFSEQHLLFDAHAQFFKNLIGLIFSTGTSRVPCRPLIGTHNYMMCWFWHTPPPNVTDTVLVLDAQNLQKIYFFRKSILNSKNDRFK